MKKLPIAFDVCFTIDCRYATRLVIIQLSPYAEAWLARQDVDKVPTQGVSGDEKIYEKVQIIIKIT